MSHMLIDVAIWLVAYNRHLQSTRSRRLRNKLHRINGHQLRCVTRSSTDSSMLLRRISQAASPALCRGSLVTPLQSCQRQATARSLSGRAEGTGVLLLRACSCSATAWHAAVLVLSGCSATLSDDLGWRLRSRYMCPLSV